MTTPYPRDLVGYGEHPPHARWPGGARIALQFVINHEEGGENNILHGDAASEAFLIRDRRRGALARHASHANMESIYEYGSSRRLLATASACSRSATVPGHRLCGGERAMARNPARRSSRDEAKRSWEIATHGLKWVDYQAITRPPEVERASYCQEAVSIHTEIDWRPSARLLSGSFVDQYDRGSAWKRAGLSICADTYADDLPYWIEGPHGPQLIVPYTLDANDMRFATPQGFNAGDQFFGYLKDSFDTLYAEGDDAPKMLSIGLHSRLVGRPGRAAALARFLDYVAGHERVWIARRIDIAHHWVTHHPPPGGYKPSHMSHALFIALFGEVFEHTPSLPEAVYAAGLTPADDMPDALHAKFVAAMHALSDDAKLALIQAHPDLAGKLALSKGLTADSAAEQGGAGLDRLSPAELDRFTALNAAYVEKFGFPFIIAVRGLGKDDILGAFETRLKNDPAAERAAALAQIERIALLRIRARLGG